jgi:hypothetical protein
MIYTIEMQNLNMNKFVSRLQHYVIYQIFQFLAQNIK